MHGIPVRGTSSELDDTGVRIEVGFIVLLEDGFGAALEHLALVKEKFGAEKLSVIPLTPHNTHLLLQKRTPSTTVVEVSQVVGIHPTSVIDAMCTETWCLHSHCFNCRSRVWRKEQGGSRMQNYRVGSDGYNRHIDCNEPHRYEPSDLRK